MSSNILVIVGAAHATLCTVMAIIGARQDQRR